MKTYEETILNKNATKFQEYRQLVEVLRVYDEMTEEDQELYKDEFVQLDWNRRLLCKELFYDDGTIIHEDQLEEDNVVEFYTKEEQKLAAQTAKELYDADILVCDMDEPELCCDEYIES